MSAKRLLLALSAGLLLAGCAGSYNAMSRDDVKLRAAFDLDCAAENLQVSPLQHDPMDFARAWGVEGCDQRAAYVFNGAAWSLDFHTRKSRE